MFGKLSWNLPVSNFVSIALPFSVHLFLSFDVICQQVASSEIADKIRQMCQMQRYWETSYHSNCNHGLRSSFLGFELSCNTWADRKCLILVNEYLITYWLPLCPTSVWMEMVKFRFLEFPLLFMSFIPFPYSSRKDISWKMAKKRS